MSMEEVRWKAVFPASKHPVPSFSEKCRLPESLALHPIWCNMSFLRRPTLFSVRQGVGLEKEADLIRAPVHSPATLCVLQAACHSHTAAHQSQHRGEY